MLILIINAGSSTVKFALIDPKTEQTHLAGSVDAIGLHTASIAYKHEGKESHQDVIVPSHHKALTEILSIIEQHFPLDQIKAVGHRVVQGGYHYEKPTLITPQVVRTIESLTPLAPLHNPHNLEGIKACQELLPNIPHVAVFDTAFHQTMPAKSFLYAIPLSYYEKQHIRKYGFHGISHSFIAAETKKLLKKGKFKLISCHLGAGCSVTAIRDGISVDNSMGFSPLQGLVMSTRSGDIDAEIITYLEKHSGMTPDHIIELLNKESGLKGLSGDADMRKVLERYRKKDKTAVIALETFVQRLVFYIGGYAAELNGVDAIVFTGGIGERSALVRSLVCGSLTHLGVRIDEKRNKKATGTAIACISTGKVKVYVIPTHEEMVIARDVMKFVK